MQRAIQSMLVAPMVLFCEARLAAETGICLKAGRGSVYLRYILVTARKVLFPVNEGLHCKHTTLVSPGRSSNWFERFNNDHIESETPMNYKSMRLTAIILLVMIIYPVMAQIPRSISYQGLVEKQGQPLEGLHTLRITFYDSPAGSAVVFEESHQASFEKGVFTILLGSQTAFPATLTFDKPYYLGISIDGEPEGTPRTALVSAPYALCAERAQLAEGLT